MSLKSFRKRLRKFTKTSRKKKTLGNKFKKRSNNERMNGTVALVKAKISSTTHNKKIENVSTESFDNFLRRSCGVEEAIEFDVDFNTINPLNFSEVSDIVDGNKEHKPQG